MLTIFFFFPFPPFARANTIPNDGLIRYLSLFNMERLLVTSPRALAEVLVTKNYDFVKPAQIRFSIGRILGNGLLLAEGDEHKAQRRNLLPAFAFRHIKDLYPVFWDKARESVEAMTQQVLRDSDGGRTAVLEVGAWASRVTLDIIGVAGLGRDFGAVRDPGNPLSQAYWRVFQPSRQARLLGLLGLVFPARLLHRLPVRRNEDIDAANRLIRATCADLIAEKKKKKEKEEKEKEKKEESDLADLAGRANADVDILSVALESGAFDDENLVDQLMTFLAAGHETTASAMTWAAYLLARHPDVQERLRAEVRERLPPLLPLLGGGGGGGEAPAASASVTSADIDRMPYLHAVCSEVLRYFSPVPLTIREAARDTTVLGRRVPRGTQIMLVPPAVNRSRALWGDDAAVFDPDRWLSRPGGNGGAGSAGSGGGATSNYAFMTFLHGPRSCIGQAFARAEFACLLAAWVGRFAFALHNEDEADESRIEIRGAVTARPANGMYLRTTVLEGW